MQFVHTPYFAGYGANASQQQQQQQQQQQAVHTSQPPSTTAANADQHPSAPPSLALPTGLSAFPAPPVMQVPSVGDLNAQGKPKRKQVKNACVNCQKACKKCDDARPCQRCIKYSLTDTCVNSVRKERKKGIKRGPYKKRKQAGDAGAGTGDSGTSNAGVTGPAVLTSNLYGSANQTAPGVRNNGVLAYPQFQAGTYDPFQAVSYQGSAPMIPHAYMVPQMYPANASMLSYHAAMNMLSPQQGQAAANMYGNYRPPEQANAQQPSSQSQASEQQGHQSQESQQQRSKEDESAVKQENQVDSDDESSKLSILSKLCSAVLETGAPKAEPQDEQVSQPSHEATGSAATADNAASHQSTPPPSRGHSRETSNEADGQSAKKDGASW